MLRAALSPLPHYHDTNYIRRVNPSSPPVLP